MSAEEEWFAKAERVLAGAQRSLAAGDRETAAHSLCYAMFYAALAALAHVGKPQATAKKGTASHGTVTTMFGLHLCKNGPLRPELGSYLNKAQELRSESDYETGPPDHEVVKDYVAHAEDLVAAVRALLKPAEPPKP